MGNYTTTAVAATAAVSLLLGAQLGALLKSDWSAKKSPKKDINNSDDEEYDSEDDSDMESVDDFMNEQTKQYAALNDEVRLAICIRKDLKMTKGKTVAQSCHATLACFRSLNNSLNGPKLLERWLARGQAKITLQIENEEHLQELWFKAKELGVMACPIRDAGRTQVEPGTVTVIGIGPAPKSVLDQITGGLKLY